MPLMVRVGGTQCAALLSAALLASPVMAQATIDPGHSHVSLERLGKVEFRVDCNAAAQQEFNRAMALYHSFAWTPAIQSFTKVAQADPSCGLAHWGRAMANLDNPFAWPANLTPAKLDAAAAALDDARAADLKTQRERDYVEAVSVFLRDRDKLDYSTRMNAFVEGMAKLAASYSDDTEASILSALILSANFDPKDKTYANQLKAAKILEPLFQAQPDHPGAAHYLIHSYDYPPIAKHGVEAARAYAKIAPDAPHALHMPSHIFTRLGYWRDSIESNRASANAASEAEFDGHHAADYMVYAHLQLAQDKEARKALEQSRARKPVEHWAAAYAYAAMPARLALETGAWNDAANLPLQPSPETYNWKKFPQAESINAFARGVGAALSDNAAAAEAEVKRLQTLRDAAAANKLGYWAEQTDIQAEIVRGLAMRAMGQLEENLAILEKAANREDATEKHAVTPGPLLPAREILADVLLAAGRHAEALQAYERVLAKEPNRYRATLGAARASQAMGDAAKARTYYSQIVDLGSDADGTRDGLQEARQIVGKG
jgi:tetratricopeptide (TPR) repeat protein